MIVVDNVYYCIFESLVFFDAIAFCPAACWDVMIPSFHKFCIFGVSI
jgi:hypothetical protein